MLSVGVKGDRETIVKLGKVPVALHAQLLKVTAKYAINLQQHVKADKLSGQVLNRKSGALSNSIKFAVDDQGNAVYGRVFSSGDVKYAAIHEFGGTIPAHDIVPSKAQALAFMVAGKQVFAKIVHMPAVTMPERSFMRSSLADMAEQIKGAYVKAKDDAVAQAMGGAA